MRISDWSSDVCSSDLRVTAYTAADRSGLGDCGRTGFFLYLVFMTDPIRLIIGLGNPGPEYETTRHNAGFWLADHLADDLSTRFTIEKAFSAWVAKARFDNETVILAKPTTFMNRSGLAAGALSRFYKLAPGQVLVLHDELDLLPGQVKLKQGGGHAGHNRSEERRVGKECVSTCRSRWSPFH